MRATRPLCALAALVALCGAFSGADATALRGSGESLRIALYNDTGASAHSAGGYFNGIAKLISTGALAATLRVMDAAGAAQVTSDNTDVVVFPGGSGDGQFMGLKAAGRTAIKGFVQGGGGYVGTCGGGFLAVPGRCCDEKLPASYCGGNVGCQNSTESLTIVAAGAAEPWDRGHGNVTIHFPTESIQTLGLPTDWGTHDVKILYWQGPIMRPLDRQYPGLPPYTSMAKFTSEINTVHPQWTKGQMMNADAIVTTVYGEGRILVSAPHPELSGDPLLPLILAYMKWAGRLL